MSELAVGSPPLDVASDQITIEITAVLVESVASEELDDDAAVHRTQDVDASTGLSPRRAGNRPEQVWHRLDVPRQPVPIQVVEQDGLQPPSRVGGIRSTRLLHLGCGRDRQFRMSADANAEL